MKGLFWGVFAWGQERGSRRREGKLKEVKAKENQHQKEGAPEPA